MRNDYEKYKDKIITIFAIRFNYGGWQKKGLYVTFMDKEKLIISFKK